MSVRRILVAFCILAVGLGAASTPGAFAQDPATPAATPPATPTTPATPATPKVFKLQHETATTAQDLDVDAEKAEKWIPGIVPGTIELSMSLGFMGLSSTLLEHQQMIYKYTTEATYWGDVEVKGKSAFNPLVRIGYNAKRWLALEGLAGLSISEYESTVVNRHSRENKPGAQVDEFEPALGEFDAEARSLITLQAGVDVVVYPFNIKGDGTGRWHPYLTGLMGGIWYDMNSDFTAGAAAATDLALGAGLRLLPERNVSVRIEATYHLNSVEFTPATYFLETNEGTTKVPLAEYPEGDIDGEPISAFASNDVNYLAWSIGFQGSF